MKSIPLDKVVTLFSDSDVSAFKKDMLEYLNEYLKNFSTHSMNESALFLQGQKDMLEQVIHFIERT